jgi:hypothetical protein
MDEAIDACEHIASVHNHDIEFWPQFMDWSAADERITKIANLLLAARELAHFEGDREKSIHFWWKVLSNGNGDVPDQRWNGLWRFLRSVDAAHHYLYRWSERGTKGNWRKEISLSYFEREFLRELAAAYYQLLGKVPGRSKSTIGPFVRFAYAAMAPVLGTRMPTIEALNDRWARTKYDVRSQKMSEISVEQFKRYFR